MGDRNRMKKIKIWFCDFWPKFNKENNFIINLLKNNYKVILESKDPDFLFYSNFGYDFLKYKTIKIFYNGENVFPNFNLCDYAISCHNLELDKRYFRLPIYMIKNNQIVSLDKREIIKKEYLKYKTRFCNFIYDNKKGDQFRKEFFEALSKYKKVDSFGKFLNNTGFVTKNKLEILPKYKFTIAFENESYPRILYRKNYGCI